MDYAFIASTLDSSFMEDWGKRLSLLHAEPKFLASFPRSGNGWIRFLLCEMFLAGKGIDVSQRVHEEVAVGKNRLRVLRVGHREYFVSKIFPDIYGLDVEELNQCRTTNDYLSPEDPLLIKTHHTVACDKSKAVFLFRRPLHSIVSYYSLANGQLDPKRDFDELQFRQAIIRLADYHARYTQRFIEQQRQFPANCLFLEHQQLIDTPLLALATLLRFNELHVSAAIVADAVQRSPFRSGFDRRYENYLDEATVAQVVRITQPAFDEARKISREQIERF